MYIYIDMYGSVSEQSIEAMIATIVICTYAAMHVCMFVCMCVHIYIYIFVFQTPPP